MGVMVKKWHFTDHGVVMKESN